MLDMFGAAKVPVVNRKHPKNNMFDLYFMTSSRKKEDK
jgi:hypothetical protein